MRRMIASILVLFLASHALAEDPAVVIRANFDEQTPEGFQHDYAGALDVTDDDFSQGRYSLRDRCETGINDIERYLKFSDKKTKLAFHYKAVGVKVIRVLARSVEDNENLYFNIVNPPQNTWNYAVVPIAKLRNVVPAQSGPESPFGDRTGEGKTFKNLVFHLLDLEKSVDQPTVYIDNIVLYNGTDSAPPEIVGKPTLYAKDGKRLLTWPDAKDNIGVAYYKIARGTQANFEIGKTDSLPRSVIPEFDLAAKKDTATSSQWYRVIAVDFDGNESKPSEAVEVAIVGAK